MSSSNLVKNLHKVANDLEYLLPYENISDFRDFIDNSEVGVGLEILLEQISENNIIISKSNYKILEDAGRGKIGDEYFDIIRVSKE